MIEKYLTKDYMTEICKNIGMYPEVTEALLKLMETHDMRRYEDVFCKLLRRGKPCLRRVSICMRKLSRWKTAATSACCSISLRAATRTNGTKRRHR